MTDLVFGDLVETRPATQEERALPTNGFPSSAGLLFVVGMAIVAFGSLLFAIAQWNEQSSSDSLIAIGVIGAFWILGLGLIVLGVKEIRRTRPLSDRQGGSDAESLFERTIGFSASDLAINRAGRMSAHQKLTALLRDLMWWLAVLFCFGIPTAGFLLRVLDVVHAIRALALVGAGVLALSKAWATGLDALRGQVQMHDITLDRQIKHGNWAFNDDYFFFAQRGGEHLKFAVSRSAYDVLTSGERYRVFVTPHSKLLMSLERAGDDTGGQGVGTSANQRGVIE